MKRWLTPWMKWLRKRRAIHDTAKHERERAAILRQIANRKNIGAEWKPKLGDLRRATTAALDAERWLEG